MSDYIPAYLVSPNYERPAFSPVPKDEARVVAKIARRRLVAKMDRIEKESVRVRDKESCRVCGKKTRDVHEKLFKSLGGVASLANSMCACRGCHDLLQQHGIKPIGEHCSKPILFQMSPVVASMVFGRRALPKHCELIEVKK